MLDKNIEKEIKCAYFDKCTKANVWSQTSVCPKCKHNKWINPKKDYYESKIDYIGNGLLSIIALLFIVLIFC